MAIQLTLPYFYLNSISFVSCRSDVIHSPTSHFYTDQQSEAEMCKEERRRANKGSEEEDCRLNMDVNNGGFKMLALTRLYEEGNAFDTIF